MAWSRRAVIVGLVPLGAIAGHVVGYWMAGERAGLDGSHGHLRSVAWLAGLAATAALVLVAARPRPFRGPTSLSWLAGGQAAMFVGLEAAEHVVGGHGLIELLTSPSFRWGLVAQALTAGMLVAVAAFSRASGERVRTMLSRRGDAPRAAPRTSWAPTGSVLASSSSLASPASERGPPRHLDLA